MVEKQVCYICPSNKHVDGHHIDCCGGELSPETVPLCRRCHRTYHDLGVDYFEDEYLDKIIEIENKFRVIHNASSKKAVRHKYIEGLYHKELQPMTRADVQRSAYWNKKHGIKQPRPSFVRGGAFPPIRIPAGQPLCGFDWVHKHLHDLDDWVPRIEVVYPGGQIAEDIDSAGKLKDVVKTLRGLKKKEEVRDG